MNRYQMEKEVKAILQDWNDLIQSQSEAPDWPYKGQPYFCSDSAGDERFEFWRRLEELYGRKVAEKAHRRSLNI